VSLERPPAVPHGLQSRRGVLRAAVIGGVVTSFAAGSGAAASTRHRFAAQRRASSAGGPGSVRVLWQADIAKPLFALTFDDGPRSAYTPTLLDVLGELGVPATFFCVGQAARAHPELVARASAEGHEIGNHSDTHANLGTASAEQTRTELVSCHRTLTELTGQRPALLRPPVRRDVWRRAAGDGRARLQSRAVELRARRGRPGDG
jgi:peptidoglycan/xylan/chitin deacetylase (PgdA/CDA1 family)